MLLMSSCTFLVVYPTGDDDGVGDVNERALASLEIYKLVTFLSGNFSKSLSVTPFRYGVAEGLAGSS